MPYLETPSELADSLADLIGIYGVHQEDEKQNCRICFCSEMIERIKQSVINENRLRES